MIAMKPEVVERQLQAFVGQTIFVHLEVNPGAYWRNGSGQLRAVHVNGDGSYRVFLELDTAGLIHVDDLTHMQVDAEMVICTGYDSHDRIARTVEVRTQPFPM